MSPEPRGDSGRATFIVELTAKGVRVDEVRVEAGPVGVEIPERLGELDFRECLSIATTWFDAKSFGIDTANLDSEASPSTSANGPTEESVAAKSRPTRPTAKKTNRPNSGAPSDLARVYWRLGGSISKVARHYEVPRQIAGDWIKDLRNKKAIPS